LHPLKWRNTTIGVSNNLNLQSVKIGTDVNQKKKLEPFSFTLSILNWSCQYISNAWTVLGLIPDLEINHLQLLFENVVVQLVKEEPQETTTCLLQVLHSFFSTNQDLEKPIWNYQN